MPSNSPEAKKPEVTFDALLKALAGSHDYCSTLINDITIKNNMLYFRIGDHHFQTYSDHVIHEGSSMFDSPPTIMFAEMHNTAEGIERSAKLNDEVNNDLDLWSTWGPTICKMVILNATAEYLKNQDLNKFMKKLEQYLDIFPGDGAKRLAAKLERNGF